MTSRSILLKPNISQWDTFSSELRDKKLIQHGEMTTVFFKEIRSNDCILPDGTPHCNTRAVQRLFMKFSWILCPPVSEILSVDESIQVEMRFITREKSDVVVVIEHRMHLITKQFTLVVVSF
ncbi:uncharacterized protein LOC113468509 isoform X2 [Diaphorina citri]|uniref:Uncharacterized protein LOC113468509 isoform X2 n=1 Tax=Diaphorina citri TaxID=121845 RepID=A0A3Q0IYF4_DIACI|nr:uncharacterized protein LOC113468509 isoform X2 [Diaphorina citri]